MKIFITILAVAGLFLTLLPSIFFMNDLITKEMLNTLMLLGTIVWFTFGTMWLGKKTKKVEESD